ARRPAGRSSRPCRSSSDHRSQSTRRAPTPGSEIRFERRDPMSYRRNALVFVLAVLGGFLGAGLRTFLVPAYADTPKALVAEEFRLVDGRGKTTARLAAAADGSPCLF